MDKAKSKILATEDEDSSRVTPGPEVTSLHQTLEPLDDGSDGQKCPLQDVVVKRRAQSPKPLVGRKKRRVTECSGQPSFRAKDETSNPSALSLHNAHFTTTEISSNSTAVAYLEAMNPTGRTPIPCDKGPGPMFTPNEVSIIIDNGALTQLSSPGIGVINSELCSGPLPQLDIEDGDHVSMPVVSLEKQHRKEAQDESLLLTTPSMVDGSFDVRSPLSQDSADEIHRELLNEHDRLDEHAMVTSTFLAMEQPLRVESVDSRPMSPKREPSEPPSMALDDKLRSELPLELYRMTSVPLDSPTGHLIETLVKSVDPEIHFSSDRGSSLYPPSLWLPKRLTYFVHLDLTICHFPKPKLPRLPPIWAEVCPSLRDYPHSIDC